MANGLTSMEFKKGDHIGILLDNCHQYMEAYYALAKSGMVAVPINWRLSETEITYVVNHSEAVALIVDEKHTDTINSIRPDLERVRRFICVETAVEGMTPYEDIIADGDPSEPKREQLDENDMVILMYTGGTTGLPKGVMLSHKNLMSAVKAIAGGIVAPGVRTLFILPFFHIANWQAFLFHIMGGCVVISRSADPEEIVRLLLKEKPTMVNLVPAVYQFMLQLPDIENMDFSFVRNFSVSGAPMSPEIMKRCEQVFGMKFGKGYGLTEAAPTVSRLSGDEYALEGDPKLVKRAESVGKAFKNVRVRICREDGTECDVNEEGEITVSGDNVMLGYWRDPERTQEALRDGWLWT